VVRLIPGVLGDERSAVEESFSDGLLEAPCYTRPAECRGMKVPAVLLEGNHAKIAAWKRLMGGEGTAAVGPDLLAGEG
jgi:tRNA (guanine37-N1)-methyltransferase